MRSRLQRRKRPENPPERTARTPRVVGVWQPPHVPERAFPDMSPFTKAALARCGFGGQRTSGASELCPQASRLGDLLLQRGLVGVGEAREHVVVDPYRLLLAPSRPSLTPLLTSALATCSLQRGLGGRRRSARSRRRTRRSLPPAPQLPERDALVDQRRGDQFLQRGLGGRRRSARSPRRRRRSPPRCAQAARA